MEPGQTATTRVLAQGKSLRGIATPQTTGKYVSGAICLAERRPHSFPEASERVFPRMGLMLNAQTPVPQRGYALRTITGRRTIASIRMVISGNAKVLWHATRSRPAQVRLDENQWTYLRRGCLLGDSSKLAKRTSGITGGWGSMRLCAAPPVQAVLYR